MAVAAGVMMLCAADAAAHDGRAPFEQWVQAFRARAVARGVSSATYARVTRDLQPDTGVFEKLRTQPEVEEELWQYLNRCVSEWRVTTGKEKLAEHAALLGRIEHDFGVEPSVMLGLWGIESAYGDPLVQKNHARAVLPALATLAWGEPQRRRYWEQQFLDALVIVDRGWATPVEMRGSWAGAM